MSGSDSLGKSLGSSGDTSWDKVSSAHVLSVGSSLNSDTGPPTVATAADPPESTPEPDAAGGSLNSDIGPPMPAAAATHLSEVYICWKHGGRNCPLCKPGADSCANACSAQTAARCKPGAVADGGSLNRDIGLPMAAAAVTDLSKATPSAAASSGAPTQAAGEITHLIEPEVQSMQQAAQAHAHEGDVHEVNVCKYFGPQLERG